ncbi:hypothetical protein GQ42DRAFT_176677 [Ramicandelaber brevisporus]|nr:hypothetical protein GQ42DRAFT_176677 [Ramicandelaber brevisporus]
MHTSRSTGSRDLVVHLPELLERALAVTPGNSSHFRLLDLPADLLEYLTLYFDGQEGVRVLTVSSAFHDVFAHSAMGIAEPTRSDAYARYGRLVRKIDLERCLYKAFNLHNWLELFPNTTVLRMDIREHMNTEQRQLSFDAISGLHGLRAVELCLTSSQTPFDLEAFATLLIARNKDHTKQPVRQVELRFSDNKYSEPWAAAHRFADTVAVLSLESLCIEMSAGLRSPPTPAQFAAVCPYLVRLPYGGIYNGSIDCYIDHNRNFFGMHGASNAQPMCPLLTRIRLKVCCASPDIYDYRDIAPTNFPQLQSMIMETHVCTNRADGNDDAVLQKILNQHWPSVTELRLFGALHSNVVDAAFLYNPQLTSIVMNLGRGIADESGVFHIERVLAPLPEVSSITLACREDVTLDTQWIDGDNWESVRSSKLWDLNIEYATITVQMLKLMTMLPKFEYVRLSGCEIDNESAAIAMLKQVQEDKAPRNNNTDGGDVDGRYPCSLVSLNISNFTLEASFGSCELVLALVTVMSQLGLVGLYGFPGDTVDAVKERFPNIEVGN